MATTVFKGILKDASGNALHVQTSADQVVFGDSNLQTKIESLSAAVAGQSRVHVVADITARDALADPVVGDQAWVKDATADATVTSGAAIYLYESTELGWVKTGEAESMDMVVSWSSVQDRPVTDEQLTDTVSKKHEHANATAVLDKLSTDDQGRLLLDGAPVDDGKVDVAVIAKGEAVPANLRSGGIVFEKIG